MYKDKIVLCNLLNAYEKNIIFNRRLSALPQSIQDELHYVRTLYREIGVPCPGNMMRMAVWNLRQRLLNQMPWHDEIGRCAACVSSSCGQRKQELLESPGTVCRVFFLGKMRGDTEGSGGMGHAAIGLLMWGIPISPWGCLTASLKGNFQC